eukprot:13181808-Alexandrium_andersonii.AAC.1
MAPCCAHGASHWVQRHVSCPSVNHRLQHSTLGTPGHVVRSGSHNGGLCHGRVAGRPHSRCIHGLDGVHSPGAHRHARRVIRTLHGCA